MSAWEAAKHASSSPVPLMSAVGTSAILAPTHSGEESFMPITQLDPALARLIDTDQPVRELATGYGGEMGPAEGPVWWQEGGYLLFSDIHNSRRIKYTPGEGASVFAEGTHQANGLTRDPQGRLVACEHEARRVTRQEPDGSITVIANSFQGRQLNRPNDVVVKSDGSIYFTDPSAGIANPTQWDLGFPGVYRVSADLGSITLIARDFVGPNGLAFSPDESILYVIDSRRGHLRAFDMLPNGLPALATSRVFSNNLGERPGFPDGMKVDVEGNVYVGGSGGVWIIGPLGNHLGTIEHDRPITTNFGFGGGDWKTLYFTTWDTLWSVQLNVPGLPVPAPRPG